MYNTRTARLLPLLLLMAVVLATPSAAQEIRLEKAVIASGGGQASNAEITAMVTAGQPAVGSATNGQINGSFGFWNNAFVASSVMFNPGAGAVSSIAVTPNPVVDNGSIAIMLERAGEVSVELYDASGSRVRTLYQGDRAAGEFKVALPAQGLASGTYHVAVITPGAVMQHPVTVLR